MKFFKGFCSVVFGEKPFFLFHSTKEVYHEHIAYTTYRTFTA